MKKLSLSVVALLSVLFLFSCGDDEMEDDDLKMEDQDITGSISIQLENAYEGVRIAKGTNYTTEEGDTFNISAMDYIISNIKLVDDRGHEFVVPNSYHYINFDGKTIEIANVPIGTYAYLEFGFGVDSAHNHDENIDKGDLQKAVADAMGWTWDTGFKFLRLEGNYVGDTSSGKYNWHLGKDENYKTIKFGMKPEHDDNEMSHMRSNSTIHMHSSFSAKVEEDKNTLVHFMTNVAEVFKTPNTIDLEATPQLHGANSSVVAKNYEENFFMIHHIEVE